MKPNDDELEAKILEVRLWLDTDFLSMDGATHLYDSTKVLWAIDQLEEVAAMLRAMKGRVKIKVNSQRAINAKVHLLALKANDRGTVYGPWLDDLIRMMDEIIVFDDDFYSHGLAALDPAPDQGETSTLTELYKLHGYKHGGRAAPDHSEWNAAIEAAKVEAHKIQNAVLLAHDDGRHMIAFAVEKAINALKKGPRHDDH